MSELLPAAQAVLEESAKHWAGTRTQAIIAALRAAVDQVVPAPRLPYDSCCDVSAAAIRAELLAIAVELEAHD